MLTPNLFDDALCDTLSTGFEFTFDKRSVKANYPIYRAMGLANCRLPYLLYAMSSRSCRNISSVCNTYQIAQNSHFVTSRLTCMWKRSKIILFSDFDSYLGVEFDVNAKHLHHKFATNIRIEFQSFSRRQIILSEVFSLAKSSQKCKYNCCIV